MNQVDLFILAIVGAFALSGARRGIILAGGDVISLVIGLMLAAVAYPIGAAPLRWVFHAGQALGDFLGFALVAVLGVVLAGWGFSFLAERFQTSKVANRIGGAGFGVVFGVILAAALILVSGFIPGAAAPVGESALGPRVVALVPSLHENLDAAGLALPKLMYLPRDYRDELVEAPRGIRFLRINFARLDGAMCINCRSPVEFVGYRFSRGTLMSPKFRCPNCGRTSDGCQTFEGFHTIYGACPVTLADEGVLFDCGVWTNDWWVVPFGPCPVCGKEHHQSPQPSLPAAPYAALTPELRRLSPL